jgi:hypothetical protein
VIRTGLCLAWGTLILLTGCNCNGVDQFGKLRAKLEVEPASVDFGSVALGSFVVRSVKLSNTGNALLTISSVVIAGDAVFTIGSTPPTTLAPSMSADVSLVFSPQALGPVTATLRITTTQDSAPHDVPLTGVGVMTGMDALCAMPVPLDLGRVPLGRTSTATLHVKNCGLEPLTVSAVKISSDAGHGSSPGFVLLTSTWPTMLAVGASFDLVVTFSGMTSGDASGFIRIDSSAMSQPTSYFPMIARVVDGCDLTVIPSVLSFYGVAMGSTADRPVLVMNPTIAGCTISRLQITQGTALFSLVSPPSTPDALASGASEELDIRYAPTGTGPDMGMLEVEAQGVVKQVQLVGNAPLGPGCHLQPTPDFLSFGVVPVGSQQTRTTRLTNISQTACNVTAIAVDPASSPGFVTMASAPGSIAPSASADIAVTYSAMQAGPAQGTLHIQSNDASTPTLDVPLVAAGSPGGICVEPRHLSYGAVQGFKDLSFNVSACGGHDVTVTALDFSRADPQFAVFMPPSLPLTIPAGALQAITVRYTPTGMNGASAVIDVHSTEQATPDIPVDLDGGPEIVPPSAGRFLYSWSASIQRGLAGDIDRLPLQGGAAQSPYWGSATSKPCSGCHALSPDGRYVALVEITFPPIVHHLQIIDTTTNVALALPFTTTKAFLISWRPDVHTTPPYQFAYDDGGIVYIASPSAGIIRQLQGAADPSFKQKMPSWGPNGKIAFVRGTQDLGPALNRIDTQVGLAGTSDIMVVDEQGGTPVMLSGASGNGELNYYPSYSPDGRWIAFTTSSSGETYAANDAKIHLASSDNSGHVVDLPNANGSTGASFPTWSADGSLLSFSCPPSRGGAGDWDIWYVPIDSSTGVDGPAVNLMQANSSGFDHIARWSP